MNSVQLIGRLTTEPSSRTVTTETGERTDATLGLAVPPERGRDGERATSTWRCGGRRPTPAPAT